MCMCVCVCVGARARVTCSLVGNTSGKMADVWQDDTEMCLGAARHYVRVLKLERGKQKNEIYS
jgi:hypothetical protein